MLDGKKWKNMEKQSGVKSPLFTLFWEHYYLPRKITMYNKHKLNFKFSSKVYFVLSKKPMKLSWTLFYKTLFQNSKQLSPRNKWNQISKSLTSERKQFLRKGTCKSSSNWKTQVHCISKQWIKLFNTSLKKLKTCKIFPQIFPQTYHLSLHHPHEES